MLPELLTEQIEENIKIQKELKAATRRLIKVIENHDNSPLLIYQLFLHTHHFWLLASLSHLYTL